MNELLIEYHYRANASSFGNQDACAPFVKYVVFFATLPALGSGRVVALTVTSFLTAVYVALSLHELLAQYCSYRRGTRHSDLHFSRAELEPGYIAYLSIHKSKGTRLAVDPMLVGILICQAVVFVYFIICTELLLQRNPSIYSSSDNEWGFGQVRIDTNRPTFLF